MPIDRIINTKDTKTTKQERLFVFFVNFVFAFDHE